MDTLRADHVGLYGYPRGTTPHLDAFFERGTVFENATSSSPCTIPSIRQYLSGGFDVDPQRPPLAEVLAARGWETAAVVSQHQLDYYTQRDYARGFDHFDLQAPGRVDHHGLSARTADEVSDLAIALLRKHEERGDGPLFLWLHYFDPHDPYEPPEAFRHFDAGNGSSRSGDRRSDLMRGRAPGEPWVQAGHVFDDEDVAHLRNLYDGEIAFADAQIARVLDFFEARGWVEDAVVVFLADHGEWLGENGWWDHCVTLREEEIRVPFALRVRGGPLGVHRSAVPASTLDVVPTVLGLLGIEAPPGRYHGVDLARSAPGRVVLSMWQETVIARDARFKLFAEGDRVLGLFDTRADPGETRNLLGGHPEVRAGLLAELRARAGLRRRVAEEGRRTIEQLKSIGYIE